MPASAWVDVPACACSFAWSQSGDVPKTTRDASEKPGDLAERGSTQGVFWIVRAMTFFMLTKRGADDAVDLGAVNARSSDLSSFEVFGTHLPCDVLLFLEIP